MPPSHDCQYIGYNWDDLVAQAGSSTDHHVSVPVYEGEKAGDSVPLTDEEYNYHFVPPCCKELMPLELNHLFKQTRNGHEENKTELVGALQQRWTQIRSFN